MRKGIEGLATLIQDSFELDPYSDSIFFFAGWSKDCYKRLDFDCLKFGDNTHFLGKINPRILKLIKIRGLTCLMLFIFIMVSGHFIYICFLKNVSAKNKRGYLKVSFDL